MATMRFGRDRLSRRADVDLNVTSFIDVIFNLLLFFILSTSFRDPSGMAVQLPQASSSDVAIESHDLVVAMTKDGQIIVDGRALSIEQLAGVVEEFHQKSPTGVLVIQADAEVPHGTVVHVMDEAKRHGLARIVIGTEGG